MFEVVLACLSLLTFFRLFWVVHVVSFVVESFMSSTLVQAVFWLFLLFGFVSKGVRSFWFVFTCLMECVRLYLLEGKVVWDAFGLY